MRRDWLIPSAALAACLAMNALHPAAAAAQTKSAGFTESELKAFSSIHPIDSHTHIYAYAPEYIEMLNKLDMHTLDIMVVSDNADPERKVLSKESADVFNVVHHSGGRVFACTTFDAYRFNDPDFVKGAIAGIDHDLAEGAIAVKEWKNVGMEIKNKEGKYILPDDPALEPIYKHLAKKHKTLIMHIADPDTAWEPPNPEAVDQRYFVEHPEWYMYKIPGSPTKEQILAARDHVVEQNPDLKVVGAHLGSMENHFDKVAADLDEHPNFAVDMTARMPYIMKLPREQAIAFITKYQDRLIYGTDETLYPGADVARFVRGAEATYARDWRFLSTDADLDFRGMHTKGLALSPEILRKIYHNNSVRWYPGMR